MPSTNELARTLCINPATGAKGLNLLVEEGILYKRRGLGMFVSEGAADRIRAKRRGGISGHSTSNPWPPKPANWG